MVHKVRHRQLLQELGMDLDHPRLLHLSYYPEADDLVDYNEPTTGKIFQIRPEALDSYLKMDRAAAADGIQIYVVSAFRSHEYQAELVRRRLARGETLIEALAVNAPPGYSEHHTGKALDLSTPGIPALTTVFDETAAFRWLIANAVSFGWKLSFPKNNPSGYVYEPWHWMFSRINLCPNVQSAE